MRHLQGIKNMGLHIKPSTNFILNGYSDVDWACIIDDRRSTAGYCVYLGDTLIAWSSKKQQVVARSSMEPEHRALAQVACEITWIESLLKELKFPLERTFVTWCDNLSASALAANPVYHVRTKHIKVDIHFIRNKVMAKQLKVRYIPS